jgi:hypothetical protein
MTRASAACRRLMVAGVPHPGNRRGQPRRLPRPGWGRFAARLSSPIGLLTTRGSAIALVDPVRLENAMAMGARLPKLSSPAGSPGALPDRVARRFVPLHTRPRFVRTWALLLRHRAALD